MTETQSSSSLPPSWSLSRRYDAHTYWPVSCSNNDRNNGNDQSHRRRRRWRVSTAENLISRHVHSVYAYVTRTRHPATGCSCFLKR